MKQGRVKEGGGRSKGSPHPWLAGGIPQLEDTKLPQILLRGRGQHGERLISRQCKARKIGHSQSRHESISALQLPATRDSAPDTLQAVNLRCSSRDEKPRGFANLMSL